MYGLETVLNSWKIARHVLNSGYPVTGLMLEGVELAVPNPLSFSPATMYKGVWVSSFGGANGYCLPGLRCGD